MYRTHALCNGLGIENNLRDLLEASRGKKKTKTKNSQTIQNYSENYQLPPAIYMYPFSFYLHYNSVHNVFFLLPFFHAEGIS